MRTFGFFSTVSMSHCDITKGTDNPPRLLPLSWAGCKSIIYSSNHICFFVCCHVANKDVKIGVQRELHNGYTSAERLQRRHTRLTSRPASLSYTQRGGKERSLSSSVLSLSLPQRDLDWERAKRWKMPSGLGGGEARRAGRAPCNRSLSAGAQSGGEESCFMLLLFVEVAWMKMAVVMQAMGELPPSIVGSAGLSFKTLLMRLWGGLLWNHAHYIPARFGNIPVLCILFLEISTNMLI